MIQKKKNWITDFDPENFKRPIKLSYDLIDANNDKKILSKGEKLNIVIAKKLKEKGLKNISSNNDEVNWKIFIERCKR